MKKGTNQHYVPRWLLRNFRIADDYVLWKDFELKILSRGEKTTSNSRRTDNKRRKKKTSIYLLDKNKKIIISKKIAKSFSALRFLPHKTDNKMNLLESEIQNLLSPDLYLLNSQFLFELALQAKEGNNKIDVKEMLEKIVEIYFHDFKSKFIESKDLSQRKNLFKYINHLYLRTPYFRDFIKKNKLFDIYFIKSGIQNAKIIQNVISNGYTQTIQNLNDIIHKINFDYEDKDLLIKMHAALIEGNKNKINRILQLNKNIEEAKKRYGNREGLQYTLNDILAVILKGKGYPIKNENCAIIIEFNLSGAEYIISDNFFLKGGHDALLFPLTPSIALYIVEKKKFDAKYKGTFGGCAMMTYDKDQVEKRNKLLYENALRYVAAHSDITLQNILSNK